MTSLKILIHALGADTGGGRRHIESFIPALSAMSPANEYTVLVREGVLSDLDVANVNIRHVPIDQSSTGLKRFMFDQVTLPRILQVEGFDICVSILNFGPFICKPRHVIFQRNALYFDAHYQAAEPLVRRLRTAIRKILASLAIRSADMVVSPTESMNSFIKSSNFCRKSKAKFEVLYHGFNTSKLDIPHDDSVRPVEKQLSIFYPSHFARHKGFEVLFDAAQILVSRGKDFRIYVTVDEGYWASGLEWFQQTMLKQELDNCVVNLGQLQQDDIWREYKDADVIFFPSQCESFGFPLLESLAYCKPIVASSIDVNREICGDGARFFQHDSAEDAADKLMVMFDTNERVRQASLARARFLERDWSWQAYAQRFDKMMSSV